MHDAGRCIRWSRLSWDDSCVDSFHNSSLPCDLVYLHGSGLSHYARAVLVPEYSWDRIECGEDVAVPPYGRALSNGGTLTKLQSL